MEATLFDQIPAARRTDPPTSKAAAREHTANGFRASNCERMLRAVTTWPGRTSLELAQLADMERHEVSRRLADLKKRGDVRQKGPRPDRTTERMMMTWWVEDAKR